ncbi:SHOCT domain-containing protein [Haladaptatus pallidirubidus]|uniref:SHOCT domain-containing protein n=1 Tax=Haladaptatus pallidirubidus TaxID=1008152 RepID=A0AAV3UGB8_9EURY|nr:SHOCT domain-containing protein [Haladaptatus pallidirubidus]
MATTDNNSSLTRIVLIVLVVLLAVPMLMMAFAFPMMGGWMTGGYAGGVPVWGWFMMLIPLVVIVALGYLAYRELAGDEFGGDPALSELRVAYARGDISDEEFETRRERLQ